jgi:multiple sugar transport system ATP-binding protein
VPLTDDGAAFGAMILPLTREQVEAARTDGTAHVRVGFRPENTDLVGPDDGGLPIHVDLVEELGSDAYVYGTVALEGQDERFVVRVDSRRAPALGDIVHVKPRVGTHHAFHALSGERL